MPPRPREPTTTSHAPSAAATSARAGRSFSAHDERGRVRTEFLGDQRVEVGADARLPVLRIERGAGLRVGEAPGAPDLEPPAAGSRLVRGAAQRPPARWGPVDADD